MVDPGDEWTEAEVQATVDDYLAMLMAEVSNLSYSKSTHRRELLKRLEPARTEGSIEFKHANISAAMIELGLPYIRGYKPRGNYQHELAAEIRRRLTDSHIFDAITAKSSPELTSTLSLRRVARRSETHKARIGRHFDYGKIYEENKRRGTLGEQLVYEYEIAHLLQTGRHDLAQKVRWIARQDGDGLGYDIRSFDDTGREKFIEVKATALGESTPFYFSTAELDFARSHSNQFVIYRVYDVLTAPRFFTIEGDIDNQLEFSPTVYRASMKST
jgi:hypothetical protein